MAYIMLHADLHSLKSERAVGQKLCRKYDEQMHLRAFDHYWARAFDVIEVTFSPTRSLFTKWKSLVTRFFIVVRTIWL